jgi:deoxyribodipyrimidine photo-lyase
MSKYLHYGHISPVYVALRIRAADPPQEDLDSYLEELIVGRELSIYFQIYKNSRGELSCCAG